MKHVMVDLETLGKTAGCKLLSIGAVEFDVDYGLGKEFYVKINRDNQHTLFEDAETIAWWEQQSHKAREAAFNANGVDLQVGLLEFSDYINGFDRVYLWGNGAAFDNVILAAAYDACDINRPWEFRNDRCYRTLYSLASYLKFTQIGTHHNALDDAKSQAAHAIKVMKHLGIK